jgi:hypothetical protein
MGSVDVRESLRLAASTKEEQNAVAVAPLVVQLLGRIML